jgi:hypothetical protein
MTTDNTSQTTIEPVTLSEVLDIASWDRPRSDSELRTFRSRREKAVGTINLDDLLA